MDQGDLAHANVESFEGDGVGGDAILVATNKGQCNCTSLGSLGLLMCHGLRSGLVSGLHHQHGSVDGSCIVQDVDRVGEDRAADGRHQALEERNEPAALVSLASCDAPPSRD